MEGRYRSGQPGQTVNLLAYAFEGSNPSRPTKIFNSCRLSFTHGVTALWAAVGSSLINKNKIRFIHAVLAQLVEQRHGKA